MPVDPSSTAALATNFGFAGIIFVIWLFDMRKIDKLQKVIEDQVEDKRTMREDKVKLLDIIERSITSNERTNLINERTNQILLRFEKKL